MSSEPRPRFRVKHDFAREGSRTAWLWRRPPFYAHLSENASWHLYGTANYGAVATRWEGTCEFALQAGRWELVIGRDT